MVCCNTHDPKSRCDSDGVPLEGTEYVARLREARAAEARERRLSVLCAGGCLVTLILASLSDYFDGPFALTAVLFLLSYLSGGFFAGRNALSEIAQLRVNVDVLMLTAAVGAALVGELPEGAVLLFLFSLSGALERIISGKTKRSIEKLMDLSPERANLVGPDGIVDVAASSLHPGDEVIVRPGERIPVDGSVVEGETTIDQSIITGESLPVSASVGSSVFAGSVNQNGAIKVRVTRRSQESTIARIIQLIDRAETAAPERRSFMKLFGERYTVVVLVGSVVTAIVFFLMGASTSEAFYKAMTLLVVASPCAVVVAIPSAMLSAITRGAREGVLCKDGATLDALAEVRVFAFDKTGTLTRGRLVFPATAVADGTSESDLLSAAASAENHSEHPIGRAIVLAATERGLSFAEPTNFEAVVGKGIIATVNERKFVVGTRALLEREGIPVPAGIEDRVQLWRTEGKTSIYVASEGACRGAIAVADVLRDSARVMLDGLRALGIKELVMLTGDHETVARSIAGDLNISFEAQLLPDDKVRIVNELRSRHGTVAMVGDGINDAPALTASDIGVSLGNAGAAVTLESADVVLMSDDLLNLPRAVELGRHARAVMKQNLAIAFGAMVVLVLTTLFATLRLPYAVLGHEGSTVLVVLNGLRLLAGPSTNRSS